MFVVVDACPAEFAAGAGLALQPSKWGDYAEYCVMERGSGRSGPALKETGKRRMRPRPPSFARCGTEPPE